MTKKMPPAPRALSLSIACVLFAGAAIAAEPDEAPVLDLREAAALLRVPTAVVLKLARAGSVPARRIGKEWRFNRAAVMQWLQGERYAYPDVPAGPGPDLAPGEATAAAAAVPAGTERALPPAELAAVAARGIAGGDGLRLAQAGAPPVPAAASPAPGAVGERPSGPTAEEVALRQQGAAVLPGGIATLEFELSYARRVRESFPVLRIEENMTTTTLTGRYGLRDNLQVTARLPASYRRTSVFGDASVLGEGVSVRDSDSYLADMAASLIGVAVTEGAGRPGVLVSLDTVLPTGPGDAGLGAGLVLSKSYDPVVVFAGLSYLYGIDTDQDDARRVLARNNFGFNVGYAYAVNDTLALSGQFAGTYRSPQRGALPAEKESYLVQLGLTWQLGRGLFVEPAIAFGVGGSAPDMNFSVNLPYTF